jgi:hypothetical protein
VARDWASFAGGCQWGNVGFHFLDVGYVEFVNFALAFWDEVRGKIFEILYASGTVVGCARKGSHVVQNVSKQPLRSDRIPALVFL